jgi:ribulose-phosphate 3-epimerase
VKLEIEALLNQAPILSVGILAGELLHLASELDDLRESGIQLVHVDVMDGVFCPQITGGPLLVEAIPTHFVKDVHLMVEEPAQKIEPHIEAGAGIVTVHLESTRHPHRLLQEMRGRGVIRGVAINPGTPVSSVEPLLDELELLLVLGVNPGWAGQSLIASTAGRIAEARSLIGTRRVLLGADGGITIDNAERITALGADLLVAGNAVFRGRRTADNVRALEEAVARGARARTSVPVVAGVTDA